MELSQRFDYVKNSKVRDINSVSAEGGGEEGSSAFDFVYKFQISNSEINSLNESRD